MTLKPCPFCGGEAEFIGGLPKSGYDRVACTRCFAEVDGDDKDKAIATWNTRPDELELVAALREAANWVKWHRDHPTTINHNSFLFDGKVRELLAKYGESNA